MELAKDAQDVARWEAQNSDLVEYARRTAEALVSPLQRRWRHVQAVAVRADSIRAAVHSRESPELDSVADKLLVASAWLHDIGYAPDLVATGLHAADGAAYLREHELPTALVNLVAHHSGARFEAVERGMPHVLADYPFEESPLSDALATADLTTGPSGESVSYDERIDEVFTRYPANDPVHRFWLRARPVIGEAVSRTEARLRLATQPR
ncbi:hypothetical protein JOF41_006445 [Saccharothrix coeruleofusca]|uniref:HD domain-containing protein n=1 Tax=Saccharothrix coeruleofusca TaxID=33919 RepID=UPI001AE36EE4|nr:HD domain-containing protein [Saccharothrix coeruleofusca]MBP2340267.1 hypothetical protein [Saccharothrix coeruleofusca]